MGGVGEGVLGTARFRVCAPWRPFLCIAARAHRLARSHSREALVAPRLLRALD